MNRRVLVLVFLASFLASGCSVVEQVVATKTLQQCTFEVNKLDKINLAGIEVRPGMKRADLSIAQVMQLSGALFSNELPLTFDVVLNIENPNDRQAMMSRMDYNILLDGREMINGRLNDTFTIPANSSALVPVTVQADLIKVFSGQQTDALVNLAFRLVGTPTAQPVELQVNIKPYIELGLRQIPYPGFITLKKTF